MAQAQKVPRSPLWALLWRLLLFGAVLLPLGLAALFAGLFILLAPPTCGLLLLFEGRHFLAIALLGVWVACLPWLRRFGRWLFEGIEYSGL